MRVRQGWSGETESNKWQKVDIELDEVDLARLCHEHDIPPGVTDRLSARICFELLQNEAESLLLRKLVGLGYPTGKASARIAVLATSTDDIFTAVKSQLAAA